MPNRLISCGIFLIEFVLEIFLFVSLIGDMESGTTIFFGILSEFWFMWCLLFIFFPLQVL